MESSDDLEKKPVRRQAGKKRKEKKTVNRKCETHKGKISQTVLHSNDTNENTKKRQKSSCFVTDN